MSWRHMGEWWYSSTLLGLGTRWRWVVNFTLLPLYSRGKSSRYPLDRRLSGPQIWSRLCGEVKNLALLGIEPQAIQPVSWRKTWSVKKIFDGSPVIRTLLPFTWTKMKIIRADEIRCLIQKFTFLICCYFLVRYNVFLPVEKDYRIRTSLCFCT
jgi:hypothetical protein